MNKKPSNHEFQCPVAVNNTIVTKLGSEIGTKIKNKICNWLHPSKIAASSIYFGIPLKKFISINTNHTSHAPGKIKTKKLSIKPSDWYKTY